MKLAHSTIWWQYLQVATSWTLPMNQGKEKVRFVAIVLRSTLGLLLLTKHILCPLCPFCAAVSITIDLSVGSEYVRLGSASLGDDPPMLKSSMVVNV
jgi:hypothetical protein